MNRSIGRDIFIGMLFLVIQLIIFRHLSIFGSTADLVLLFILWLSTIAPRSYTLLFAAAFGILQDAFLDIWGMNMFSKVLVVMISYSFLRQMTQNKLFLSQTMGVVFGAALVHNLGFLGIAYLATDYNIGINFFENALGNSLYTAIIGALIYLFKKED
jgi:rod shape-determining protein MreD